jgi:hypothetical protein
MGNAYNNASLLVTPNGYKASKIYSAKPTDGTGDLAFSRASTAMRRNSAGLWETVANNVPRLQYPVGGGCPSWLFEPQATNLQLQSLNFNLYFTTEVTVTAGQTPTVLSGQTSTKLTDNSVNGVHRIFSVSTGSGVCKASIYAKKDTLTEIALVETVSHPSAALFDLNLGTIIANPYGTAQIENAGDGWFRCSIVFTASGSDVVQILLSKGGTTTYVGSGESLYIQQNQLETGSVATSPIITAGSAVTRLADFASKTASLLNQTNFSIFFDYKAISGEGGSAPIFGFTETTGNNLDFYVNNNEGLNVYVDLSGGYLFGTSSNAGFTIGSQSKVLVTYNGTTLKYFINGVLYGSAASSLPYTARTIYLNANKSTITNKILFFPATLSDSEAIELTTI